MTVSPVTCALWFAAGALIATALSVSALGAMFDTSLVNVETVEQRARTKLAKLEEERALLERDRRQLRAWQDNLIVTAAKLGPQRDCATPSEPTAPRTAASAR